MTLRYNIELRRGSCVRAKYSVTQYFGVENLVIITPDVYELYDRELPLCLTFHQAGHHETTKVIVKLEAFFSEKSRSPGFV